MAVSVFCGAFGLGGRIGERKHDRPLVDVSHGRQHLRREGPADGCYADDRSGLERLDRGEEIADRRMIMRVAELVVGEACAVLYNEAARVHEPGTLERV